MDRFTALIASGVVALVIAGLAVTQVARGRETPPDLSTPSGVVLAYAVAEQRGDGVTAWNLLAPSTQARGDRDRFIARVASTGARDREYLTVEDANIDADGASVFLVQTFTGSGGLFGSTSWSNRVSVRLARVGNDWRITVPADDYALSFSKP
jgi:hypothetical protein